MRSTETVTEADILAKVVAPDRADLTPDAARSFLAMRFDGKTTKEIRRYLQKNNRGTITAEERIALEKYLRVGQFLDLLQAKARLSLKQSAGDH